MQSHNFKPGVSGWKLHKNGSFEFNSSGDPCLFSLGKEEPLAPLEKIASANITQECSARSHADDATASHIGAMQCNLPKPFVVVDGVTYIRQDHADNSSAQAAKLAPEWAVKLKLVNGQYVAASIGLGIASQFLVSADRFAINGRDAGEILKDVESLISKTELCKSLVAQAEKIKPIADTVREVLREELQPGGILHRK